MHKILFRVLRLSDQSGTYMSDASLATSFCWMIEDLMGDVHIYTGCDPRLSEALDRLQKLEEWRVALVDEFRQRAERLDTIEASVAEMARVMRDRIATLEAANMDAEAMKAALGALGAEMDQSMGVIGGIVTANTAPPPVPAPEPNA